MILSDIEITRLVHSGKLIIDPFDRDCVQPSSVDVHLADTFRVFSDSTTVLDPYDNGTDQRNMETTALRQGESFLLEPGDFALASTVERFKIPNNIVAVLNGKSSLGRLGLMVHATAGYIDPGFEGDITLELSNVTRFPIKLYPGMGIGQITFQVMERDARRPYGSPELGSKYQNQSGPTESRYGLNGSLLR